MNPFKDKEFMKKFIHVSFPVMIHAFVIFIVSFVDNIMVGSISNEAVSGVYSANQATYIFIVSAFGLIAGAGIMIQQFLGAKDAEHQKQSFRFKLIAMTIFLAIIVPIYYIFGSKILWFYSHSDANVDLIMEQGQKYLNLAIISYIPYGYTAVYSTSLRETGKTKYAMIAGIAAFITNVVLNSILIFACHLGVQGAAIATIVARIIELIIIVLLSHFNKLDFCHDAYQNFKIEKKLTTTILKKSGFLFANEVFWVSGMVMISLAYAQRDNVLSALSVVNTMSDVFGIIFQGLSVGIGVLVGGCLGANEFEKAKEYVKKLYVLGAVISFTATVILVALSPFIPMMFSEINAEQKKLASELIRIYACYIPFYCMCASSYMILRTGGKTFQTFLLDSCLLWTLYIPTAWLLSSLTNLSLIYIYIIVQSADILKTFIGFALVKRKGWLQNLTKVVN